jgi:RimJ/RimL family protein N-acetyltransferase
MPDPAITVRPATEMDLERLLAWSHDPVTPAATSSPATIAPETHRAWLAATLADPTRRRIWIGLEGRRPVGVIRVQLAPDGALDVAIALAPLERGQGRSRPLLDAGLEAAREAIPGRRFRAWIRSTNAASMALFRGAGFEPPPLRPGAPAGAPVDAVVLERD